MYRGFRIIAITCFGRSRYTDILTLFTKRSPLIDRHELWINTQVAEDLESASHYCEQNPDFFVKVESPAPYSGHSRQSRLSTFYEDFVVQADTIFIRFDDDIVWMADDAIQKLLDVRIDMPHYFLIFANTVNNSLCSHLHQRIGALPPTPWIEYACLGEVSWSRWETASAAHRAFFETVEQDPTLKRFLFPNWQLLQYERCSINCIAWFGSDNEVIRKMMGPEEEHSLATEIPRYLGRPNLIAGGSLVCHFAYYTQRDLLEANTTWIENYRRLAESHCR
jgi:hypothetical protein